MMMEIVTGDASTPSKPLLIWDGDCSFCKRWITRWQNLTAGAIDYEPSQRAAERFPQIPREQFGKSVVLVEPDGTITTAAAAVFKSLSLAGQKRAAYWLYRRVPPLAKLAEVAYAFVARHRNPIDVIDRMIVGTETRPATYVLTRGLFLRGIGVIYLIAFWSYFAQVDGLIGSNGILPAANFIPAVATQLQATKWWTLPTLTYFGTSDAFLHGLCITGLICSALLIVGVLPLLMTITLWAIYLSLVMAGQIFLGYQWDFLLLEAGFLAILFSPILWAGERRRPSSVVLFLIRWLLFRLMFLSALVKWFSGDSCWRDMTALRYHFETQPIPAWTSWYLHHGPTWLLAVGCAFMFFAEAIVPFLYFAPRRTRLFAFWITVVLQLLIMVSGNYGFFNLLTIGLAFSLLDDAEVGRLIRLPLKWQAREINPRRPWLRFAFVWPLAVVVFLVSTMAGIDRLTSRQVEWIEPLASLQRYVQPFGSTNAYGLFAVMTKERPEIIFEGSDDGRDWKEYAFKWKAGDVRRAPEFCEPHMPRLDWQLWFAAFDPQRNGAWLQNFAYRLLTGQPEVLKLIGTNPFPNRPPKFIRAVLYDYRFSTSDERKADGAWWVRKPLQLYIPPMSINRSQVDESFRL